MNRLKRLTIIAVISAILYFGYSFVGGSFGFFGNACQNGNFLLVALLLHLGADPDGGASDGPSEPRLPLCLASEGGHLHVVRQLLRAGAHVNVHEGEGISPLDYAIMENHPDVAKALLEAGASTKASNGGSPLETARNYHRTEIIALLEQRTPQ